MDRRKFIRRSGGLLVSAAAPLSTLSARAEEEAVEILPNMSCRDTRRQTPGPYPMSDVPVRRDIRENMAGTPLRLKLRVHNNISCHPTAGAVVDIWQSDAEGRYSAVENIRFDSETLQFAGFFADLRGEQFLRGRQIADESGVVEFISIFPGWYFGRVPHIHVRVQMGDQVWTRHDTQLYLPTDIEQEVYTRDPYLARGQNPLPAHRDLVTKGDQEMVDELTIPLDRDGDGFGGKFDLFV